MNKPRNICSILGNDFQQLHKKHESNNQDIDFDEPVDEFEALEDNGDDEKRNKPDEKEMQNILMKNKDFDYNGGEPDNNDDDNFEDEEEYPLEYDGSDSKEDEDNENYDDDDEQDYWDVDSEKEPESENEEQENQRDGEGNEVILILREVAGMSPRISLF